MNNCNQGIMDGMAAQHEIISFDYRGVGATLGEDPKTIRDMAKDCIAFIRALGYETVDIMAFSKGGFISLELMEWNQTWYGKSYWQEAGQEVGME